MVCHRLSPAGSRTASPPGCPGAILYPGGSCPHGPHPGCSASTLRPPQAGPLPSRPAGNGAALEAGQADWAGREAPAWPAKYPLGLVPTCPPGQLACWEPLNLRRGTPLWAGTGMSVQHKRFEPPCLLISSEAEPLSDWREAMQMNELSSRRWGHNRCRLGPCHRKVSLNLFKALNRISVGCRLDTDSQCEEQKAHLPANMCLLP